MSIHEIYNFQRIDEQLVTGGQPTEAQLRAAAADGFQIVINLAPYNPDYSLRDEASLVRSLGMEYHAIPVDWGNPTLADFLKFEELFQNLRERKILFHCVANYRVTAFYGLYAMKRLGWTEEQADELRRPVWQGSDYPVWDKFIKDVKSSIFHEP